MVRERLRDRHKDDEKRDESPAQDLPSKPERSVSANSKSGFEPSNVQEKFGILARKVEDQGDTSEEGLTHTVVSH